MVAVNHQALASFNVPPEYDIAGRGSMRAASWKLGLQAAFGGEPESACPYKPGQGSGSFRRAWIKGHQAGVKARKGTR